MSSSSEDFDRLLDEFINSQLQNTEDHLAELNDKSVQKPSPAPTTSQDDDFSVSSLLETEQLNNEQFDKLYPEEKRLYNAYNTFIVAVTNCGNEANVEIPEFHFTLSDILPRFRPSRAKNIHKDILSAWEVLILSQPTRLQSLPANPSDEQILTFAEKTTDSNLQNALISYVETLIELESCEVAYNLRKVKYQKYKIEKQIFEEEQRRREKMRQYIKAIRAKNFPIDAEMLVNNFFKTSRKDPDGAQKVLENSPATFAPIQFDKIKPKFFGLIKPKPEDGIRINKRLGKFLKHLKA